MQFRNFAQSKFVPLQAAATMLLALLGLGTIKLSQVMAGGPWFDVCGGAVVVLSVILALVIIGRHILGPLDAAARHRRRPTQFTMADFLALVFLFQLPVALIRLVVSGSPSGLGFAYGFAWFAASLMWGLSVQTLSRAGIATPWRRVVFLSAVLPIAYFGSVVFVASLLVGCVGAIFFDESDRQTPWFWQFFAIEAALLGGFYWAGWFVRATLAKSQGDDGDQQPTDTTETTVPHNPLD